MSVPRIRLYFSGSKGKVIPSFFSGYTSTTPPTTSPAPSCSTSSQARFIAWIALLGSSPFSKMPEASVRIPSFFADTRILAPSKHAASKSMVFTLSVIIEFSPPMMPPMPTGFLPSQIIRMLSSSTRSCPSKVVNFSPCAAFRTTILRSSIVSRS